MMHCYADEASGDTSRTSSTRKKPPKYKLNLINDESYYCCMLFG